MSQSDIDGDFLDGLTKIIGSIEKSSDSVNSVLIKDEVDHWCPDVQAWHTADHESAEPPKVHISVEGAEGDDPYKSENDVEKQSTVGNENVGGGTFGNKDENRGMVVMEDTEKEYDQNTNLPPETGNRDAGESIAEPFLRQRKISDIGDDIEKQAEAPAPPPVSTEPPQGVTGVSDPMSKEYLGVHEQSVDMLKIWAAVDRELKKSDSIRIVDDITILESFDLDIDLTVDDLVKGTLVYKMLTDRATRPTNDWWDASMNFAKNVEGVSEPGILSAFLYYESDYFSMGDFTDFAKDIIEERGKSQDLEMPENSSGGGGMSGLGLSADGHSPGPGDEDCD
jgi:hypothetical protein